MGLFVYDYQIVLQEVPNEVSISFSCVGCPLNCRECSWKNIMSTLTKYSLDDDRYIDILDTYKELSTCVLFYGGEWEKDDLVHKLKIAKSFGYKTCLYTGLPYISKEIKDELTFLKVGPYIKELGALNSELTNQRFYDLRTGEVLNHYFLNKDPLERNKNRKEEITT